MLENQGYALPITVINEDVEEESKEFFAQLDLSKIYDGKGDNISDIVEYSVDDEMQNLISKTTRKKFKPVLKQLKDKIVPIKKSMKTREEQYLLAKGLPVDEVKDAESDRESSNSAGNRLMKKMMKI